MYEIQIHTRFQDKEGVDRLRSIIIHDQASLFTWRRLSKRKVLQELRRNADLFLPLNINQRYSARVYEVTEDQQLFRISPRRFLHVKALATDAAPEIVESTMSKRSFKWPRRHM